MSGTRPRALLLTPEAPDAGLGGGPMRVASIQAYLEQTYEIHLAGIDVVPHSRSGATRVSRNLRRLIARTPPLWDRFSGYEPQIAGKIGDATYEIAVIEHFWCAQYADLLRPRAKRLVLDLHNVESELAASHATATGGAKGLASAQFSTMYRKLEREWFPKFDTLLVSSIDDQRRAEMISAHPNVRVFPNAIPFVPLPKVAERNTILFTGNLEYHPNVEAVRWFRADIWPQISRQTRDVVWELAGRNANEIQDLVAGDPRIRVTGPMENAVQRLAEARVCIVPLRSGSGTRFKIVEAWAAGRAVVSTSIGAEGLGAQNEGELLLADDAAAFADRVVELLSDTVRRTRLGSAGRQRYEENFTWEAAWRQLDNAGGL